MTKRLQLMKLKGFLPHIMNWRNIFIKQNFNLKNFTLVGNFFMVCLHNNQPTCVGTYKYAHKYRYIYIYIYI